MPKQRWMEPSEEPPEQRAARKRLAQEQSLEHSMELLDKLQREPKVIAERPDPKVKIEPPAAIPDESPKPYIPPPELLELVQIWQSLGPRDQLELLYIARIKSRLDRG